MTSWPLCARYHALVVPMTPAPRTITLMPASDRKQKGESSCCIAPGNESTLLTFARQARFAASGVSRSGIQRARLRRERAEHEHYDSCGSAVRRTCVSVLTKFDLRGRYLAAPLLVLWFS